MFFTSIKLKWISFTILFLSATVIGFAQVTQTRRLEIPINFDFESHHVVTLDTSGIVLYRTFKSALGSQLELTRLDTALKEVWKGFVPVQAGFNLVKAKAANGKIYFFFRGHGKDMNYSVMIANPRDGSYFSFVIQNQVPFNATEFVATDEAILIAGYFNFRPIVLHYSLTTQRTHPLPGFLNEPGELIQIKPYRDGNIDIVVSAKNSARKKSIWIRHFSNTGELIKTVVVEPDENKNLIYGRVANMMGSNQVVAGVYGRNTEYARGVFVATVDMYGEYVTHYYSFAELKNFFHYMKAKREKRIKDRIERRRVRGKKTKFNYRLLVHELIPYNDQFVLLGEAFLPRYHYNGYGIPFGRGTYNNPSIIPSSRSLYGMSNQTSRPNSVFDGYQYTHAIAIGFDKQANLTWDNSFEINGIQVFQLEQFVKIFPGQEHILLAYLYEDKLRTKIIKGDQVTEGTVQSPIKTYDGQEELETRLGKLEYWYRNHFFVYGVQTVKTAQGPHKVFFINKLRAH